MYTFNVIHTYDELLSLKQQWDNLLDHAVFDTFFCCHDWICCWWLSFAQPDDIMTVVMVEKDGKLAAVAPLMIRSHKEYGFSPKVLRFIGVPNADRCDIIIGKGDEAVVPELASFLLKKVQGWDQLHLNEVPEESLFAHWLVKNKSLVYVEPGSECPYVPLANWETWDDYYAHLSKKTRLELNRKNNKLKKEGDNRYFHVDVLVSNHSALQEARSIERDSSKAQRIENLVLVDELHWQFQQFLIGRQQNFKVLLSCLDIHGDLVAYLYGFIYKNKYYAYNTAYSNKSNKYYPGKLLMNETLRYAKENGIVQFEFLRGGTHLKKRWAKDARRQNNVYWLKNKPINWLYAAAVFKLRPFVKKNIMPLLHKQANIPEVY
jgi:CelD/BcsL family acetyltransferase involved in cellulose biosynthesis